MNLWKPFAGNIVNDLWLGAFTGILVAFIGFLLFISLSYLGILLGLVIFLAVSIALTTFSRWFALGLVLFYILSFALNFGFSRLKDFRDEATFFNAKSLNQDNKTAIDFNYGIVRYSKIKNWFDLETEKTYITLGNILKINKPVDKKVWIKFDLPSSEIEAFLKQNHFLSNPKGSLEQFPNPGEQKVCKDFSKTGLPDIGLCDVSWWQPAVAEHPSFYSLKPNASYPKKAVFIDAGFEAWYFPSVLVDRTNEASGIVYIYMTNINLR